MIRSFTRRKTCRFCADRSVEIDYKNAVLLRDFITERSKIVHRRVSGTCAYHQRVIAQAIKRARAMALLPYTEER